MTIDVTADPEVAVALAGIRFLRTFDGTEPSPGILSAIRERRAAGVVLFRARNIGAPAGVRELCRQLQAARPAGSPPLVIGLDQEGGQLQAVGDGATAWPGNLALGATRSTDLAARAGRAIGLEAAAMGATLVFAPVCDLLEPASATPLGTRPFGSDAALVGPLAAAMVTGLQGAGVAAVLKHFPGHGAAHGDSHAATPIIRRSHAELRETDLRPFAAGIAGGAMAVLIGHLAVPALTGGVPMPATVSRAIIEGLLRDELGFTGLTVSDAMDMGGAGDAGRLSQTLIAAAEAGMDLLLMAHPPEVEEAAFGEFVTAVRSGRLDPARLRQSETRILAARRALDRSGEAPPLEIVGCGDHRALAREIARASVTLVSDPRARLPLRLGADARVALIAPVPIDLTPAETSSYLSLGLGQRLRDRGVAVDEFVTPIDPTPAQVAALVGAVAAHDVVLVGTIDAVTFAGQAGLVGEVAAGAGDRRSCVAVALRSPYDVSLYPASVPAVCTYGIQAPQMEALADALVGAVPFPGSLPIDIRRLPVDASGSAARNSP